MCFFYRFVCDPSIRQVKIEFEAALPENFPCHFIFKWTSYQVCPSFTSKHHTKPLEKLPTPRVSSSKTGLVFIIFLFGLAVLGVIFLKQPENRERLHSNFRRIRNMCQRNQDEQDHNLLFQSNVNIPTFGDLDDDEDLIIA